MNRIITIICFVFYGCATPAQTPSSVNKKAVEQFNKAIEHADYGETEAAITAIKKAIEINKNYTEAYIFLGSIYNDQKKYTEAEKAFNNALQIDPKYAFEYRLPYAISLAGNGFFQQALEQTNLLLASGTISANTKTAVEKWKRQFQFAVDYEKNNTDTTYQFNPKNLGDAVNSVHSEYFPSLTIDNNELVFTRNLNRYNENFFYSQKINNEWQSARPIPGNVNTPLNEGAQMISADGQWLVFTGCERREGMGSCDIYISYLTDEGWSPAKNIGRNINTEFWESQPCLSPDKKRLFFASRRPGGYGGSDIYVSHLQDNGSWGKPQNLGPTINTAGEEQGPFLHADNQTLFFTSNGWPGYGETDLFYSRQQINGEWQQPTNLGYPINTIDHEGTIFIAADGVTAYYSSDRSDSKGGLDIYSFELKENLRPIKTLWVKGKVFDAKTGKGINATVDLIDINTQQLISQIHTNDTGYYLVTLPVGKDYAFSVNKQAYLFYSDHFLLSSSPPDSSYEKNIPLQPIEINASIVLQNIFFDINKYELKDASQIELNKLVKLLQENPSIKVEISGHTDNTGTPQENLILSNNRAMAVVGYLVEKGINKNRLIAKGYGQTQPIADNETSSGRALNRRTEMKIIER